MTGHVGLFSATKRTIAGQTVYFKVWDVDDPFDQLNPGMVNVDVIDNNTTGPDNRGTEALILPWAASATTGADGRACVTFTVSMQPGNNYRAGASLLQDALNQPPTGQTMQEVVPTEKVATPRFVP